MVGEQSKGTAVQSPQVGKRSAMIRLELQAKVWVVRVFRTHLYPCTLFSLVVPSTAHTEEKVAFSPLPSLHSVCPWQAASAQEQ